MTFVGLPLRDKLHSESLFPKLVEDAVPESIDLANKVAEVKVETKPNSYIGREFKIRNESICPVESEQLLRCLILELEPLSNFDHGHTIGPFWILVDCGNVIQSIIQQIPEHIDDIIELEGHSCDLKSSAFHSL